MSGAARGLRSRAIGRANDTLARDVLARVPDVVGRDERIYVAVVGGGAPARAVARAAGISHVAVMKTLRRVEDLRDDPAVDRRLTRIEMEIAA